MRIFELVMAIGLSFGFGFSNQKGKVAPAASGGAGDSLLLFNSQGVTLLHLGLI